MEGSKLSILNQQSRRQTMKNKEQIKEIVYRFGEMLDDENAVDLAAAASAFVHICLNKLPETQVALLANFLGAGEHKKIMREIFAEEGFHVSGL